MSRIKLSIGFALVIVLAPLAFGTVQAQTTSFTYQGRLTDGGNPANGNYDLQFSLFDAGAGGNQIGSTLTRSNTTVTAGAFTVQLDFGFTSFPGADRFLEIGVKLPASAGFTTLAPRQQITSTPYSVQTINSEKLGGIDANQYVKTDDPRLGGSGNNSYVQNSTTQQANVSFNIDGNGLIGGQVGIGTQTPAAGLKLDVNGQARFVTGGSGGAIGLGSPNSETGMTIASSLTRADVRFDGSTLKLVTGLATGPPSSTNGIAINGAGNVGIGTTNPVAKLDVAGNVSASGGLNVSNGLHISSGGFSASGNSSVSGNLSVTDGIQVLNGLGVNSGNLVVNSGNLSAGGGTFFGNLSFETLGVVGQTALCFVGGTLKTLAPCSSSLRYKTDLHPFLDGLNIINRLRPITYKWKSNGIADVGFGAEDVAAISPFFITRNDQGQVEGVKYERLSVVFVNAFKEQQTEIERQQQQLKQQREKIESERATNAMQQEQLNALLALVCRSHRRARACKFARGNVEAPTR